MGRSTDRTLVQKTSLTASKRSLSHRRSLAVLWVLYQNIFAEGLLWEGGSCAGKGAGAAGRTTVLRSLTSKVHSRTCRSIKGHCVRTRPGDRKEMWQKLSNGWKDESHRIQAIFIESYSRVCLAHKLREAVDLHLQQDLAHWAGTMVVTALLNLTLDWLSYVEMEEVGGKRASSPNTGTCSNSDNL